MSLWSKISILFSVGFSVLSCEQSGDNARSREESRGQPIQLTCQDKNYSIVKSTDFSKATLLPTMKDKRKLSFCIQGDREFLGFGHEVLKDEVTVAVEIWDQTLQSLKQWPKSNIKATLNCSAFDFRLEVQANGTKIQAAIDSKRLILGSKEAESLAQARKDAGKKLELLRNIIRHEIGHLLGLGDTYATPIRWIAGEQPRSIMRSDDNYKFDKNLVQFPTQDDLAGLTTVLEALKGNPLKCQDGYKQVENQPNRREFLVCASKSGGEYVIDPARFKLRQRSSTEDPCTYHP